MSFKIRYLKERLNFFSYRYKYFFINVFIFRITLILLIILIYDWFLYFKKNYFEGGL
jgi:hypothetical protein